MITIFIFIKEGLYRIWCGVNRLGDSGVHTLGDTSAFVNPAGQLLLTRRGKTRMDGVGIVVICNYLCFKERLRRAPPYDGPPRF